MSEEVSESVNLSEGGEEGEARLVDTRSIIEYFIRYILTQSPSVIIGIFISIAVFLSMYNQSGILIREKIMWTILPTIIGFIYLWISVAPTPKRYFFLSAMFGERPINMGHSHKKSGDDWVFTGSAVINIDDKDYIFIGGGREQDDSLLEYVPTKGFVNIIGGTGLSSKEPTYSAVSIDMDGNGLDDLIVGRGDGITLYKQIEKFQFVPVKLFKGEDKVPLALSVSDYNKDGKPDIYVSYFTPLNKYRGTVFNDPTHDRQNVLLKNTSKKNKISFVDVTVETESGGRNNTFTSAFVDLDNDTYPDLVLSHDSGDIEILRNKSGKSFESIKPYDGKGNWMGIAVGDINNDGNQDMFLTNLGSDIVRDRLALGDIRKDQKQEFAHVLLRNDGKFKFVDVKDKVGVPSTGFGWGAIMADLDSDSNIDLIFGENFMLNPHHWLFPGVGYTMKQGDDGKFTRDFSYNNPHFAQTPLLADVNQDGRKDIIWINYGGPSFAYLNKTKGNYINVKLPETVEFANAKVVLDVNGKRLYREIMQGGIGFGSDSSNVVHFGLGKGDKVDQIRVYTTQGKEYWVKSPKVNSTLVLKDLKN